MTSASSPNICNDCLQGSVLAHLLSILYTSDLAGVLGPLVSYPINMLMTRRLTFMDLQTQLLLWLSVFYMFQLLLTDGCLEIASVLTKIRHSTSGSVVVPSLPRYM